MGRPTRLPERWAQVAFADVAKETLPPRSDQGSRARWTVRGRARFGTATKLDRIGKDIWAWQLADGERVLDGERFPDEVEVYQLIAVGAFASDVDARRFLATWRIADATRRGGRLFEDPREFIGAVASMGQPEALLRLAHDAQKSGDLQPAKRALAEVRSMLNVPGLEIDQTRCQMLRCDVLATEARMYSQLGMHSAARALIDDAWCRLGSMGGTVDDDWRKQLRVALCWRAALSEEMIDPRSKTSDRFFEVHKSAAAQSGIRHQLVGAQVWGQMVPAILRGRIQIDALDATIEETRGYEGADPSVGYTTPALSLVQADLLIAAKAAVEGKQFSMLRSVFVASRRLYACNATLEAEGVSELLDAFDHCPTDETRSVRTLLRAAQRWTDQPHDLCRSSAGESALSCLSGLTRGQVRDAWDAAAEIDVNAFARWQEI